MTSKDINSQQPIVWWQCKGDQKDEKKIHPDHLNQGDKCTFPGCEVSRPKNYQNVDDEEAISLDNSGSVVAARRIKPVNKARKDKNLLAALSVLNLGSGYTTMVGAAQIFPGLVGYVSGGIIQLILFLLLSGSTARHAPIRKWITVTIFSAISIYTSFFAYYDTFTAKEQKQKGFDRAIVASQKVYSDVFAPLEKKFRELEGEIQQKDTEFQKEVNPNQIGYEAGFGPRAIKLKEEIIVRKNELAKLKPTVDKFSKMLPSADREQSPERIFQSTIQALQILPNNDRPSEYQGDLNKLRSQFFDEDTGIPLLTPYRKIMKGEDAALYAMLVALAIDGLIILLGTAIENRKKIQLNLFLKTKGTDFLQTFYEQINHSNGAIDYSNLNTSLEKEGFNMLLNTMRDSELKWVGVRTSNSNEEEWYIFSHARDQFTKWYSEERSYQSKLEAKNGENLEGSQDQIAKLVKFILPSRKSS